MKTNSQQTDNDVRCTHRNVNNLFSIFFIDSNRSIVLFKENSMFFVLLVFVVLISAARRLLCRWINAPVLYLYWRTRTRRDESLKVKWFVILRPRYDSIKKNFRKYTPQACMKWKSNRAGTFNCFVIYLTFGSLVRFEFQLIYIWIDTLSSSFTILWWYVVSILVYFAAIVCRQVRLTL